MQGMSKKRRIVRVGDISEMSREKEDFIMIELEELSRQVLPCLQCTTCASSCPVFQVDSEKNPRRIIYKLSRNDFSNIFNELSLWWCGGCYSCQEHCPQGVALTGIFFKLKNLAFRSGERVPNLIIRNGGELASGFLIRYNDRIKKIRGELGLPEIMQPSLDEIKKILQKSGFFDLLEVSRTLDDE